MCKKFLMLITMMAMGVGICNAEQQVYDVVAEKEALEKLFTRLHEILEYSRQQESNAMAKKIVIDSGAESAAIIVSLAAMLSLYPRPSSTLGFIWGAAMFYCAGCAGAFFLKPLFRPILSTLFGEQPLTQGFAQPVLLECIAKWPELKPYISPAVGKKFDLMYQDYLKNATAITYSEKEALELVGQVLLSLNSQIEMAQALQASGFIDARTPYLFNELNHEARNYSSCTAAAA